MKHRYIDALFSLAFWLYGRSRLYVCGRIYGGPRVIVKASRFAVLCERLGDKVYNYAADLEVKGWDDRI